MTVRTWPVFEALPQNLEFVPVGIDFRTESFVKLDTVFIPFGDPPLDHSAAGALSLLGDGFHQESSHALAAMAVGNVELFHYNVWFCAIGEGDEVIHKQPS